MVSTVKPYEGSGSGLTYYAYQLIKHMKPLLSKHDRIDELYALDAAKKNNVAGLVGANTAFKRKIAAVPNGKYDIIHILDQEIGFAAKALKKAHNTAKIITTVHDLARFEKGLHRGLKQSLYNKLVRGSAADAIRYSDVVLCNSTQTRDSIMKRFPETNTKVIYHGTDDRFLTMKKRTVGRKTAGKFVIGYIGALAYHKNVIFILKTAAHMKDDRRFMFRIYGEGPELKRLMKYKKSHSLDNVELMGYAPEKDKIHIYDSFDVFMFPSLYEGLGHPILEAEVRGLPVIICKGAAIPKEVSKYCMVAMDQKHAAKLIVYSVRGNNTLKLKRVIEYADIFAWKTTARCSFKIYKSVLS